ncbi:penicillin-binding protein 1B [Buchnera aphidicola]|uniref:penicillin-binding protein 1B n=1 Tax=Buchnera aphidicola TaxID=9 RepID=UPI003CE511EC
MFFFIFCIIIFYGVYLYIKIHQLIHGKVWDFPNSIYTRIINLEPGNIYSQEEVLNILKNTMYRKVDHVMSSGEYSVKGNVIELIRRSFNFPDLKEEECDIKLFFKENILKKIINVKNGHNFLFMRLEPKLIAMLNTPKKEKRIFLPRNKFPEILVKTLISIEDKHFYEHHGIYLSSIVRAFLANITAGHVIQGGSTLTQQLIKNLFLTNERSILRKINEIYMALILDYFYEKDRILELYLNEVYLGQDGDEQIRGFPLASIYYFGRPINELTLDQYALLVGMVKGASLYNPWNHPISALKRRNLVLLLLYNQKYITKDVYLNLSHKSLNIQPKSNIFSHYPHFIHLVSEEFQKNIKHSVNTFSGIKIFTTLDSISQNALEKAVQIEMSILKKQKKLKNLEVATIVIDKFTGEVQALMGSANPKVNHYNYILHTRREIGSLSNMITYLTALSQPNKYHLNTWISNSPIFIKLNNGKSWVPTNNQFYYNRKIMLLDSFIYSMNNSTENISIDIGLKKLVDHWLRLGIDKHQMTTISPLSLGDMNLTPIEIAQVFQIIANNGHKKSLISIKSVFFNRNKIFYHTTPQLKDIESPEASYLILYAMQKAFNHGSVQFLGNKFKNFSLAGKIGTTKNFANNWFIGIDGKQVVIIWIGQDNNKSNDSFDNSGAIQIYKRYLQYKSPTPLVLIPPKNINIFYVDKLGRLSCKKDDQHNQILPIWNLKNKQNNNSNEEFPCYIIKKKKNILSWWKSLF